MNSKEWRTFILSHPPRHGLDEREEALLADFESAERRAPSVPLELVVDLAVLVRWYRRGQPIEGVPKYLHGVEADKALARFDAFLAQEQPQGKEENDGIK